MPVDVAASKKAESIKGFVLGRKPYGPLDTDKISGIFAPAVWARPMKILSHRIPLCRGLA
jgi:hypothetical protein